MRWLAKAEISTTSASAGTSPRPRTVSPKTTGAARMRTSPRHGTASRPVAEWPKPVCHDREPQRDEKPGKDQREVAGAHAQRRAESRAPIEPRPNRSADRDEDETGADVLDVEGHRHTPAGSASAGRRRRSIRTAAAPASWRRRTTPRTRRRPRSPASSGRSRRAACPGAPAAWRLRAERAPCQARRSAARRSRRRAPP